MTWGNCYFIRKAVGTQLSRKTKMKTRNGRPQQIGQRFFRHYENGGYEVMYCMGYCDCGKKIGLTRKELEDFSTNLPGVIPDFIARLVRLRVLWPK